jgi:hypothetical protein
MRYDIDRLVEGLRICAISHPIPIEEILAGIEKFKSEGMRNEWLFKSRTFREHSLKASLLCTLTMEEFSLRLQVERRKELVFNDVVIRTDPDEIAFEPQFKDIKIADNHLVVTKRYGDPLLAQSLEGILK